jgi:DNA-binding transcriptional LysR family regulator
MDRLEAINAFVATIDDGSMAAAGRRLGKSPPAMTRAIANLEMQVGVPLFERTTRLVRLTEAGEQFAEAARRILLQLEEINLLSATPMAKPHGLLTISAPVVAGTKILAPIVDAFLNSYPAVRCSLLLSDRSANLVSDGMDIALRIAHLPNSTLIAIPLGSVRRVVCASPDYLARMPQINIPSDIARHQTITLAETHQARNWSFASRVGGTGARVIRLEPRLSVNDVNTAKASAIAGHGLTRLLSYQVADSVHAGRLKIILPEYERRPLPVQLIASKERLAMPKTRCFVDFAVPLLRAEFAALSLL